MEDELYGHLRVLRFQFGYPAIIVQLQNIFLLLL